jgi:DNA-binding transcriptional ArsR family regulator
MPKKIIPLSTKEELSIYMSPQRQQLLRIMGIEGKPMTAKRIADRMGVSASSATLHINKLAALGIVEEDHTERINGILARYYRLADVTVNIGGQRDDGLRGERRVVMQNMMLNTLRGLESGLEHARKTGVSEDTLQENGDFLSGVLHLRPEDAGGLMELIRKYIDEHETYSEGTEPWEYSLIVYNSGFML